MKGGNTTVNFKIRSCLSILYQDLGEENSLLTPIQKSAIILTMSFSDPYSRYSADNFRIVFKNVWRCALLVLACLGSFAFGSEGDAETERQNVLTACTGCHCLEYYVVPRSRNAWELTVSNMRNYTQYGSITFSEEQGERVVEYLATYFNEDSSLDAATHFLQSPVDESSKGGTVQPPTNVLSLASTVPQSVKLAKVAKPKVLPPALQALLNHPKWKPSRTVKHVAEAGGYLAVICTLMMFLSGHNRRHLVRWFRPIHILAALGLFLGLATHAIIYLMQYGTPPVLWYWFGIGSFFVLVLAQFQGIVRKRFGPVFLRIHVTAGYCGLTLAILHWIWAWM